DDTRPRGGPAWPLSTPVYTVRRSPPCPVSLRAEVSVILTKCAAIANARAPVVPAGRMKNGRGSDSNPTPARTEDADRHPYGRTLASRPAATHLREPTHLQVRRGKGRHSRRGITRVVADLRPLLGLGALHHPVRVREAVQDAAEVAVGQRPLVPKRL